jgi:hypothetical protein
LNAPCDITTFRKGNQLEAYKLQYDSQPKVQNKEMQRKPCHLIDLLDNTNANSHSTLHDNQIWSYQHSSSLYTNYIQLFEVRMAGIEPSNSMNVLKDSHTHKPNNTV